MAPVRPGGSSEVTGTQHVGSSPHRRSPGASRAARAPGPAEGSSALIVLIARLSPEG